MTYADAIQILRDLTHNEFAQSLVRQFDERGKLSEKQWFYAAKIAREATVPQADTAPVQVGGLETLGDKLRHAADHLKFPKLLLKSGDVVVRLSIAGERSRNPGSITVCSTGSYDDRVYYGRIVNGTFLPSNRVDAAELAAVIAALEAFSADPEKAAAAYGHETGQCCFCNKELTDERSTNVGYGPTCAKNFDLPWGKKQLEKEGE